MLLALNLITLIGQLILALIVSYLLMLTVAAWFARKETQRKAGVPKSKFLVLIPAHNEERLLPSTLENQNSIDYPKELYQVHVVADNCTDSTAAIARRNGAIAHERFNNELRGKGYALQWLIERLWQQEVEHDAIVIIDADTIVSKNFLSVMDTRLQRGERVIQAYYAVRDPDRSWGISLRYAALAVLHYLRPLGRMVLGGSTGLKGNGMVFAADVMKSRSWTNALTEDIEFHMELIRDGERAMFSPDAVVWAEMPETLADSQTQNTRWEQGRMEMIRNYVPGLIRDAFSSRNRHQKRTFLLLDAAIEQLIPPFSILAGLTFVGFILAVLLPSANSILKTFNIVIGSFNLVGQIIYLIVGLYLAKAPSGVYRALLYAPVFVLWKIWLYLGILFGRGTSSWIRTARNE